MSALLELFIHAMRLGYARARRVPCIMLAYDAVDPDEVAASEKSGDVTVIDFSPDPLGKQVFLSDSTFAIVELHIKESKPSDG